MHFCQYTFLHFWANSTNFENNRLGNRSQTSPLKTQRPTAHTYRPLQETGRALHLRSAYRLCLSAGTDQPNIWQVDLFLCLFVCTTVTPPTLARIYLTQLPPPWEGFLFGWFPNEETGWFPNEEPRGRGPLPAGSSFGNHPKRKPPRGGIFFQSELTTHTSGAQYRGPR